MIISAAFTTVSKVVDALWSRVTLLVKNIGISGATNNSFRDDGPYNFLPTRYGDTTQGSFSPYGPLSGDADPTAVGGSAWFDGSGDFLATANSAAFALGTDNFTFECWINPANWTATYSSIFVINANPGGLYIGKNGSNFVIRAYGVADQLQYATLPPANAWTHVAAVRSGTTLSLFYDGIRVATTTNSYNFQQSNSVIGDDGASGSNYTGSISNLRFVKGTAVYDPTQTSFTPPKAPLTAVSGTSLLTCQSATTITDASSNAFAVTRYGDVRAVVNTPFGYGSVYFDGNADYLLVPSASNAVAYGTGDFTVEFWGWASAHGKFFVTGYDGSAAWNGINVGTSSSTSLWWLFGSGASAWTFERTPTYSLSLNTWHHFAVTRESGTAKLWVDGVLVDSVANTTNFPASNWYVGGCGPTAGYWNTGYVSNLRVIKGTALYTSNFTPPTAPLTAVSGTSLLTCQDKVGIVDASSNAIAITRAGDTKPSSLTPFAQKDAGYWSAYFDGSGDTITVAANSARNVGTSGDFTVEGWFNISTYSFSTYWNVLWQATDYNGLKVMLDGAGYLRFSLGDTHYIFATTLTPLNQWIHVAVVRYSGTVTLYLNGTSLGSAANTAATSSMAGAIIIGSMSNSGGWITGYVSNFRMTNSAVYTSAFAPPTSPLSAVTGTTTLICRDNRLMDSSGYNLAITKNGDVSVSRLNPFGPTLPAPTVTPTGSVFFDGSGDQLNISSNSAWAFGTGAFCVELWINPQSWPSTYYAPIIRTVGGTQGFALFNHGGNLVYHIPNAGDILTAALPATGAWSHIALCRSGSTVSMFVNGARVATTTNSQDHYAANIAIGGSSSDWNTFVNAYISNVRIVKGSAVYDPTSTTLTVPTAPLTAISGTGLLTCQDSATVTDASSNNFTVTKVGDAKAVEASPFKRVTTAYGGSVYLDGSGDWLQLPTSSSAFTFGTGDFTMEFWIYALDNTLFSSGNWYLFDGNVNYTRIQVYNGTMYFYPVAGNYATYTCSSLPSRAWHHIAMVRSGSTLTGYVNGIAVGTASNSSNLTDTTFTIGAYSGGGGPFNAYMSDFRITKGVAVYTSNFTPPVTPLTAIGGTSLLLRFDNAAIYDASNNNDMQTVGDTKTSTAVTKFSPGVSTYFDGSGDRLSAPKIASYELGTGDFTVEAWVYLNALAANTIVSTYGGWWLQYRSDYGGFAFGVGDSFLIYRSYSTTGTWVHVAATRSGTSLRLFFDGVQQGATVTDSSNLTAGSNLVIGNLTNSGSFHFNGYIQDVRVTKGAARYTTNFTPPATEFPTTAG